MSYTIRDVDSAVLARVKDRNITVRAEDQDIRVRVYVGSPDELIAQKRLPFIGIESGWMIRTPVNWQPDVMTEMVVSGNSVDVYTCRMIDVFFTYKIGFYVSYQPHCSELEMEFLKMFPRMFLANVVDVSGVEYSIPFVSDEGMINMDEATNAFKRDQTTSRSGLDGDLRIYRRDKLVTAQLTIEESSVETLLRPFGGMRFEVSMNVASTATVATVAMPTIIFTEE
jgi:hypothetical protein